MPLISRTVLNDSGGRDEFSSRSLIALGKRKQLAFYSELSLAFGLLPQQITVGFAIASECLFLEHQRPLRVFESTFEEHRAIA